MDATKRSKADIAAGVSQAQHPLEAPIAQALATLHPAPLRYAVALSAGADSAMLAVHAARHAQRRGLELHCLHVHHGLQDSADRWSTHAHDLAQALGVACHSVRVQVDGQGGDGMEAAARTARYEALADLARQLDVACVLLAHHRDDQAETVLLRLLRGAGPTGLGAMAPSTLRHGVRFLRPWLDVERSQILAAAHEYGTATGWWPVNDPTNADDQYTRAAVRGRLAPQLDARWPGWRATLARHARQSRELAEVLHEVAQQDMQSLALAPDASSFSLARWRELSPPRQALVLRHWLAIQGQRMPTDARLQDIMRQLRGLHALGHDRQMRVRHGQAHVCCTRGRVWLELPAS